MGSFWNELNHLVTYKTSLWEWKIVNLFHLNISFILFDLEYSGEACTQERVVIHSGLKNTIGRYCGRRYFWSVFASSQPIIFEFYTFQVSTSKIVLQYQITCNIFKSSLYRYKTYENLSYVESITFVNPFSWNHKFMLANICYYVWTIIVPKMFRVLVKIQQFMEEHKSLIPFDSPDFNSNQLDFDIQGIFTASFFQVLMLYVNKQVDIGLMFTNNILKYKVHKYYTVFKIKERIKLKSELLSCAHAPNVFCTLEVFAPRSYFVNITLISLKYSGPNTGYCKYGGLSIYDNITSTMKEVLLLCNNKITDALNTQSKHYIVSSTQVHFLYFMHTGLTVKLG